MRTLRIGTRGSQLALFQANSVKSLLQAQTGTGSEVVVIRTSGDRLAEAPLSQIGGKRLFVKEIEDALLAGEVDLAVHSSKDMPAVLPGGLVIAGVLPREDPRDALVLPAGARPGGTLDEIVSALGRAPRIGTSSVRRMAQLAAMFPDAQFVPIRGNLDTRLRKLDAREADAMVLAAAGLRRLQQGARISFLLPADACVPAPGQGIIAVEVREDDRETRAIVERIDDPPAAAALEAERAVVRRLGGGCQMPIGAYAHITGTGMQVTAVVLSVDGQRAARASASGAATDAEGLGTRVADELIARGAGEILAEVSRDQGAVEGLQP